MGRVTLVSHAPPLGVVTHSPVVPQSASRTQPQVVVAHERPAHAFVGSSDVPAC